FREILSLNGWGETPSSPNFLPLEVRARPSLRPPFMVRMHAQKRKEASLGPFPSPWSSFSNSSSIGRLDFQDAHEDDPVPGRRAGPNLNSELSTDRSAEVRFGRAFFVRSEHHVGQEF